MATSQGLSPRAVALLLLLCACGAVLFGRAATALASATIRAQHAHIQTVSETRTVPYTVVIDAGHGGEDNGTQSAAGLAEKTVNLHIALLLRDMLEACGIPTVMTRQEDILLYDPAADHHGRKKMLDLATRRSIAEQTEHALFVSIHMNAFPEEKYHGLQVFYSPHDPSSREIAMEIQSQARLWLDGENTRKVKEATSAIYLLDRLTCPAVLVECGFLSNPAEAALFESEEHRQKVAFTIFCALLTHISRAGA